MIFFNQSLKSFFNYFVTAFTECGGEGLSEDIYITIPVTEGIAGYRLFNGTHQFGSKADSRGVIVKMERGDRAGLRDCWRSRFRDYLGKYHILLTTDMIDRFVVQEILESKCVAGLIVTDPETKVEPAEPLSHDGVCPNRHSDVYGDECLAAYAWNDKGFVLPDGLRNIDWKMQILYVYNKTYVETIKKCYDLYNVPKNDSTSVSFPLCAASFGVFSTAAGSTEICYRRSKPWSRLLDLSIENRDPLVGVNILSYLPPKIYKESTPAHTLDSFGLIPEISPGEISVLTSVIALLAAAKTIGMHSDIFEKAANVSNRHVIAAFFDGVLSLFLISLFAASYYLFFICIFLRYYILEKLTLEVQQLGIGDGMKLFAHADGQQFHRGEVGDEAPLFSIAGGGVVLPPSENSRMPPSSWHPFFRIASSIRGIVLAPFQEKYEYRRINSMLDRAQWNSTQRSIAISQVAIAASALVRAAGDHVDSMEVVSNRHLVPLIHPIPFFPIFKRILFIMRSKRAMGSRTMAKYEILNQYYKDEEQIFITFLGFYAGKSTYVSAGYRNPVRFFVEWLAIYATGSTSYTSNVKDKNTCDDLGGDQNVYVYTWQADPQTGAFYCYRSSVDVYQVNSPAQSLSDYDFTNRTFSTWTESLYSIENLQLYLVERESFEIIMLFLGILLSLISFLVYSRSLHR
ncbi:unnamed protein product [Haemonchus placei]|uniref:Nicastrin n=1 Tax=Haemonchus placei TaxID=6290 RepID=A0A0N4WUZ6_HAEPC|nr:unnamed protein product [Haemonchus placei]